MISPSSSYNKCKNTKHREDFCDCFPLKQNELEPFEIFQLENSMIKNENLIFELFEFDEVFDNFLVDISQVARRIEKEDTSKSCFKLPISPPLKIQTDNQINCIPVEDFQTNNSSGSSLLNESTLDNGDIESQKRKHKFEKTPLIASKRSKASNRINKFERRHRFFPDQVAYLEQVFSKNHYPNSDELENLARELGIKCHTVTVWFQNRRARLKRNQNKRI